jgi:large subunit ribosomal protein L24
VAGIKKNDSVLVIAGKDKGKKGKVLRMLAKRDKAIVEGVNMMKKHMRPTRDNPKGGIVAVESPIQISNIMLVCARCGKQTKIGYKKLTDGTKKRICKKCQEII